MTAFGSGLEIVRYIYLHPGIYSQDALVRMTGFSISKVSRLCKDAQDAGFIKKTDGVYVYGPLIQKIIKGRQ